MTNWQGFFLYIYGAERAWQGLVDFSPALFFVTSSGTTRLCHKGGHGGAAMRGNGKDQRGVVVRLPLARRSCARQPLTLLSSVTPFPASLRVRGAQRRAVQRGGLRHGQGVCGRHRSASPGDEWLHGVRGLMRPWQSPWGRGGGVQTPGARGKARAPCQVRTSPLVS